MWAASEQRWLFVFNDTATTEIYTLSLHDALPIFGAAVVVDEQFRAEDLREALEQAVSHRGASEAELADRGDVGAREVGIDRKSTRLNSSHANISYAVFCLKKKKTSASVFLRRLNI